MVLILLVTLLVVAIAFYQVLQGLYSALIMLLLSIFSAMVAFNFYLPVSEYLYEYMTGYTEPVCLVSIFVITLGVVRLLFDRFLGSNVVLGTWADRIGGGAFGLLTGMILVGVLTIGMQMLPFTETVLTYRPFDEYLQRDQRLQPFRPDEFTLGLMKHLSAGSMSGDAKFGEQHGDLLREAYCFRNTAGKNGSRLAKPESMNSATLYERLPASVDSSELPAYPLIDRGPQDQVVVRTKISSEVMDNDNWWRIPGTQVQLRAIDDDGNVHKYYPVAYLSGQVRDKKGELLEAQRGWELHVPEKEDGKAKLGVLAVVKKFVKEEDPIGIDWVFSIRQNEKPTAVVFRGVSEVTSLSSKQGPPPLEGALSRIGRRSR